MQLRVGQGSAVCIYPEAQIRPFRAGSFAYPVRCGVPAVPYTVTYRQRRFLKWMHPCITAYIGAPIYPVPDASERKERQRLRDAAYAFMTETAEKPVAGVYPLCLRRWTGIKAQEQARC